MLSLSILQSVSETLPDTLVFPAGQLVHETEPADTENLPGSHWTQVLAPRAEEMVPGPHLVHSADPSDANLPAMHSEHVEFEVAPSSAEYVPPGQASRSDDPPGQ